MKGKTRLYKARSREEGLELSGVEVLHIASLVWVRVDGNVLLDEENVINY